MGDDMLTLSTKNESLKTDKSSYNEKWSEEIKVKLRKHFIDEKKR